MVDILGPLSTAAPSRAVLHFPQTANALACARFWAWRSAVTGIRSAAFNRSELLVGAAGIDRLAGARVILFGIGGVGSWTAEALVRSGLGHLTIVDSDGVCITNLNRQLQATTDTVGRVKVEVLAQRLLAINPALDLLTHHRAYCLETRETFALETYDYVLDAIDSLSPKLNLILQSLELGRTVFSCMGASGKLDPTRVRVDSVWKSEGCALARRIRKRLRKRKPRWDFKVVYSPEMLAQQGEVDGCGGGACHCPAFLHGPNGEKLEAHEWCSKKAAINGSMVTVTATFGMFLAALVINDVLAKAGLMPPERGTFEEDPDPADTETL